jgi:hypothetical protein
MAGQVTFVLDSEPAKAVAGFLRVLEASKKVEQSFKPQQHEAGVFQELLEGIGEKARDVAADFFAWEGVKELIKHVGEEVMQAREHLIHFQEQMKGGATIGANLENVPGFKERTHELAFEGGFRPEEIDQLQQLRAKIAVATGGDREESNAYEESAVRSHRLGLDTNAVFEIERSLRNAFGVPVSQAENMMEFGRQKGRMSISDQQETIPGLVNAATNMGMSAEDFQSVLSVIGQTGGPKGKTGMGFFQGYMKFPELADKGILTDPGNLANDFQELKKWHDTDLAGFNKEFGRRSAGAMYAVISHPELLGQAQKDAGGASSDLMNTEFATLMKDPEALAAFQDAQAKTKQHAAEMGITPGELKISSDYEKRKTGAIEILPVGTQFLAPAIAGLTTAASLTGLKPANGDILKEQGQEGLYSSPSTVTYQKRALSPEELFQRQFGAAHNEAIKDLGKYGPSSDIDKGASDRYEYLNQKYDQANSDNKVTDREYAALSEIAEKLGIVVEKYDRVIDKHDKVVDKQARSGPMSKNPNAHN